jgi:hypothetical protein
MTDPVECTCISDGRGLIKLIDLFCLTPVQLPNGQWVQHKDLGTAVKNSPYDEVAKELLADD